MILSSRLYRLFATQNAKNKKEISYKVLFIKIYKNNIKLFVIKTRMAISIKAKLENGRTNEH